MNERNAPPTPESPSPVQAIASSRPARLGLIAILLLSAGLRLQLASLGGQEYWPDELRYEGSRQAVNAALGGNWKGAAESLLGSSGHILFPIIGVVPAWLEHVLFPADAIPPGFAAAFFGLFGVGAIAGVWLIARRETGDEPTATWCAFFYAGCVTALFFSRHYFPYDVALCLLLLGWWQGLRSRSARGHWLTGVLVGFGYLTYNAYWNLGAVILVFHVLRRRPFGRPAFVRAGWTALGLFSPIIAVFALARGFGFDLVANAREFSHTVTQGGFGGGWRYIPAYFATAEGLYGTLLVVLVACGVVAGLKTGRWRPLSVWLLMGSVLAAELIFFSDVIPRFALAGRFIKPLGIFLALAAGGAAGQLGLHRWRWLTAGLGALAAGLAAWNFHVPLTLQFPHEFRIEAEARITAERRRDPDAPLQMYYADFMHQAKFITKLPPHTVLLHRLHPLQYRPYQFEGYDAATRRAFQAHDFSMRLVRLTEIDPRLADDAQVGPDLRPYPGALELEIDLPFPRPAGHVEPLVATGVPGHGDLFSVAYLDAERIEIVADHWGWGARRSAPFSVPPGVPGPHHVALSAGSLLPPLTHPALLRDPDLQTLAGQALVVWDGNVVMREPMPFYPAVVMTAIVGGNYIGATTAELEFTGKIGHVRRTDPRLLMTRAWGVTVPDLPPGNRSGYPGPLVMSFEWDAAALQLTWPETTVFSSTQEGNDCTVTARKDGSGVVFSLWAKGTRLAESRGQPTLAGPHELEIWSPVLTPPPGETMSPMDHTLADWMKDNFLLTLDGRLLLQALMPSPGSIHPSGISGPPAPVFTVGRPWPLGATGATGPFPGKFTSIRPLDTTGPVLLRALLRDKFHGATLSASATGPLRMKVRFPTRRAGAFEPLFATGGTGIADLLIVAYEADGRIRIGHDHWGSALLLSEPVDLDPTTEHVVDISMGSLYPTDASPWARSPHSVTERVGRLYVAIDGRPVLTGEREFFVAPISSLVIGKNLPGASTCGPQFTGEVLEVTPIDPATMLPPAARLDSAR